MRKRSEYISKKNANRIDSWRKRSTNKGKWRERKQKNIMKELEQMPKDCTPFQAMSMIIQN